MWNIQTSRFEDTPQNLIAFYDAIDTICKQYDLSISHEDTGGSFVIENYKKENVDWLKMADVDVTIQEPTELEIKIAEELSPALLEFTNYLKGPDCNE